MKKMIFLYTGNKGDSDIPYPRYTDSDIMNFGAASSKGPATEFVVTGGNNKNHVTNQSFYIESLIELADRVKRLTGKNVYFGTPRTAGPSAALSLSSASAKAAENVSDFLDALKSAVISSLGSSFWTNSVNGIYLNHEHVLHTGDSPYGQDIDFSNPKAHPQVKMFETISNKVHAMNKEFIWAPYYGHGPTYQKTTDTIGAVANLTDIFDFVYLQPNYYFEPHPDMYASLIAIRESLRLQKVVGRMVGSKHPVIGEKKNSHTVIGCQMEIDQCCFKGREGSIFKPATAAEVLAAYNKTADCFNNVSTSGIPVDKLGYTKSKCNFSFYCAFRESPTDPNFIKVQQLVNKFYRT